MLTIAQTLRGLKWTYYLQDYETSKRLPQILSQIIPDTSYYKIQEFLDPFFARYDDIEDQWIFGSYDNAKKALDFITAQLMASELSKIDDMEDVAEDDDWNQL